MQQQITSYQERGSTFIYLSKSKILQLITTTIIDDSIDINREVQRSSF